MKCKVCLTNISSTEKVECTLCKNKYHHNCVNITTAYYMANYATHRQNYTCDSCTRTAESKDQSSSLDERYAEPCYVTERKLRRNSNESLVDLSYQSLPNMYDQTNQEYNDLKCENERLKLEIAAAHTEIDNLNSENTKLMEEKNEYEKKLNLCRSVGLGDIHKGNTSSPKRFLSPRYRNIQTDKLKIGFPRTSLSNLTNNVVQHIGEVVVSPHREKSLGSSDIVNVTVQEFRNKGPNETFHIITNNLEKLITLQPTDYDAEKSVSILHDLLPTPATKTIQTETSKKVMIFADERGRGVRTTLQHLLGPAFTVTSVIKPNASLAEILSSSQEKCKYFSDRDFIIILAGSNDRDPLDMQCMLYSCLNKLKHTNVQLCNVAMTRYIFK